MEHVKILIQFFQVAVKIIGNGYGVNIMAALFRSCNNRVSDKAVSVKPKKIKCILYPASLNRWGIPHVASLVKCPS